MGELYQSVPSCEFAAVGPDEKKIYKALPHSLVQICLR